MSKRILAAAVFSLLITAFALPASAKDGAITHQMVVTKNERMEQALNARQDRQSAIKFLHEHISNDANFRVTVVNPTMPEAAQGQIMNMDKANYINSYIQGTNFIADYTMDIQTTNFQYNKESGEAYSIDIMTERGLAMNPYDLNRNNGKQFVSRTTCRTRHQLKGTTLVSTGSDCKTEVSFEESI